MNELEKVGKAFGKELRPQERMQTARSATLPSNGLGWLFSARSGPHTLQQYSLHFGAKASVVAFLAKNDSVVCARTGHRHSVLL